MHVINEDLFKKILDEYSPDWEDSNIEFAEQMMQELINMFQTVGENIINIRCPKILISDNFPDPNEEVIFINLEITNEVGYTTVHLDKILKIVVNEKHIGNFLWTDIDELKNIKVVK